MPLNHLNITAKEQYKEIYQSTSTVLCAQYLEVEH